MRVHVVDLRGQGGGGGCRSVLADPTGRRRRWLTRVGRATACVLGAWLCGLGLAGLDLLPARLASSPSLVSSSSAPPRGGTVEKRNARGVGLNEARTGGLGAVMARSRVGDASGGHPGSLDHDSGRLAGTPRAPA
jgi:hypothetical protein